MENSSIVPAIKAFLDELSRDDTNNTLNSLIDCISNLSHHLKSKELKRQFCHAKDRIKNNKQSAIHFLIQILSFIDNRDHIVFTNINNVICEIIKLELYKKSSSETIRFKLTKDFIKIIKVEQSSIVFRLYDNKSYAYKAVMQEKFEGKSQVLLYRNFFQVFKMQFYAIGNLIVKVHEQNREGLVLHVFKEMNRMNNYYEKVFNKSSCFVVVKDGGLLEAKWSALKNVEISWWGGCWIFASKDEEIGRYFGNPFEESLELSMPFAVENALDIKINGESYCLKR